MQKHTRGWWAKKIVYYFGGVLLLVEVVVIVALAILTAESNREILEKVIPARFLTPWLLLVYMLVGLILIKYGSGSGSSPAPEERSRPDDILPGLRERIRLFCAQVSQFVELREHTRPSYVLYDAANHDRETNEIYLQRFAPQIPALLAELALEGVSDAVLDGGYLLNSNPPLSVRSIAERITALANQLPMSQAHAPDVTMQGRYPSHHFTLHARGHACEIRTGPIIIESAIVGTMKDGERTMQEVSQRYEIEFPVVGDLRDGDKEVVEASLFCGEGYNRSAWPERESKRTGMAEFFRWAEYVRRVKIGEPDVNTCTDAEMNDFAERIRSPLAFSFEITFWNAEHTQQWKRVEVLIYEPPAGTAFVRHGGVPEPLFSASIGVGP